MIYDVCWSSRPISTTLNITPPPPGDDRADLFISLYRDLAPFKQLDHIMAVSDASILFPH